MKLSEMKNKETAKIIRLDGGRAFKQKMAQLNIREGKDIKKVVSEPLRGPVIVMVDNSSVAIGHGLAEKIIVEKR